MSQEITVTITLDDDVKADVTLTYVRGAPATWTDPADPDEYDITEILVYHIGNPTHSINMTDYLLQTSDFEDRNMELIRDAVQEEIQDNTPDCDDLDSRDSQEGW